MSNSSKIKDGKQYKHFIKGFKNSILVFIFSNLNIIILKDSAKESIKNIRKVLYIAFIIGISIIAITLIIRIILIIICTPKYIGSRLTKKVSIANTILESIYFGISKDFLEITYIPHTITNTSGILLKKNSIQVSLNIFSTSLLNSKYMNLIIKSPILFQQINTFFSYNLTLFLYIVLFSIRCIFPSFFYLFSK